MYSVFVGKRRALSSVLFVLFILGSAGCIGEQEDEAKAPTMERGGGAAGSSGGDKEAGQQDYHPLSVGQKRDVVGEIDDIDRLLGELDSLSRSLNELDENVEL